MPHLTAKRSRPVAAVLLAIGLLAQIQIAPAAPGPPWQYAVENDRDGLPRSVYARLKGEGTSFLWLSCTKTDVDDGKAPSIEIAATVAQRRYLGSSDGPGRQTVVWFDGGAPDTAPWAYRDKYGQLVGEASVNAFVTRLAQARSLKVELSTYRLEPVTVDFRMDPDETKAIAERFHEDCGHLQRERS